MLDLGDILRHGSPPIPDGEPPADLDLGMWGDQCGECALAAQHDGPCAWICHHCQGTGKCPACGGSGDDGSGLDYTCMECGGGSCPYCDDGLETDDTYIGPSVVTVNLPEQDVT